MEHTCVIGLDYGTDSVRALLVDAVTGQELASSVFAYPRWGRGLYCETGRMQFRQHPLDYLEGLKFVLSDVLEACPDAAERVRAIAVDATASTPCLVDRTCKPLSLHPEYLENPDAMFVLWKDHTAQCEAQEIIELCEKSPINYARHSGNHYSAECFWAKVLHLLRGSAELRRDAWAVLELCDWIPAVLTGCADMDELKAGHCVSGSKLMWAEEWGGFPPVSFFEAIDPMLVSIVGHLNPENYSCDASAGNLSEEWAARLGLPRDVVVCVGNIDSHSGAVGAGIRQGTMVLNLGTSACHMAVMPPEEMGGRIVEGIFGQVDGSILSGMVGFEAGLSAFGDIYAWFKRLLCWPVKEILLKSELADEDTKHRLSEELEGEIMGLLTDAACRLPQCADAPLATDYLNGRRSPYPCNTLTGTLTGLTLATSAPEIYYALVEATAFATKAILDHLAANGICIHKLTGIGGISQKSPFVMQMLSDVMQMPIHVADCRHSCALGAVIHAATVAGVYPSVAEAQRVLCPPVARVYTPDPLKAGIFRLRYERYCKTADFTEQLIPNRPH